MTQPLIKNILRKVGNYLTFGIPILIREVGIRYILGKVGNHSNEYLEFSSLLNEVGSTSKNLPFI